MRGSTCVRDTTDIVACVVAKCIADVLDKLADSADGFERCDSVIAIKERDPCGVIATILQSLEAMEECIFDIFRTFVSKYSTHNLYIMKKQKIASSSYDNHTTGRVYDARLRTDA